MKITYRSSTLTKMVKKNPYHVTGTRSIDYYAGTHTLIDPLKRFKDYRLFYYLAPAEGLTNELYLPAGEKLLKPNDWNAYPAVDAAGVYDIEKEKNRKTYALPVPMTYTV